MLLKKITSSETASQLIHDVNPSQLSGTSHRSSEEKHYWMLEALLDARRDTVTQ